jgi:hypothetical protein
MTVIDTPGTEDSNGAEADDQHFQQMVAELRREESLNVLALVIDFGNPRFDGSWPKPLMILASAFKDVYIWDNLCLVFTHVSERRRRVLGAKLQQNIVAFRKKVIETMSKHCSPPRRTVGTIPTFCIDLEIPNQMGPSSRKDLADFLAWANAKRPISLENLYCPSTYYKEYSEREERTVIRSIVNEEEGSKDGRVLGAILGVVGGGAGGMGVGSSYGAPMGAVLGSVVGPAGTAVGAAVGTAVGAVCGVIVGGVLGAVTGSLADGPSKNITITERVRYDTIITCTDWHDKTYTLIRKGLTEVEEPASGPG